MHQRHFLPLFLLLALTQSGVVSGERVRPDRPKLPRIAIPRVMDGDAAIEALGSNLPAVAKHYGVTPEHLGKTLRGDRDMKLDRQGQLFFEESHVPVPVDPPGPGSDQPGLVPALQTFLLHSRPSATRKIYLDFDGHTTTGTFWTDITDNDHTFVTPPYDFEGNPDTFTENELFRIQYIWQRVAEDYSVFDVDVTTEDPGVEGLRMSDENDVNYGVRVCIGGSSTDWYSTLPYGGVAYVGSFNWDFDSPCYVWSQNLANGYEKYVAEAVSHEVGHTLGLFHDGTSTQVYYPGHGSGADGWAPIMGTGYYQPVVQFSRGEYADANNLQDDLARITEPGYLSYIADDFGNTFATASVLPSGTILQNGFIEQNSDVDVFRIDAGAGTFALNVSVDSRSPNLNVEATLYNAQGAILAMSNPPDSLGASLNLFGMAAGTYYFKVAGVGAGNPLNTGYSDYGSIGTYTISGTVPVSSPPLALASASPTSGVAPLTVQFSSTGSADPDGGAVTYSWALGNGATSTEAAPLTTYTAPGVYSAVLTVTDDEGQSTSVTVVITVTDVPPAGPTELTASATSSARVDLVWVDNASNETGYQIERSDDGTTFTLVGTTGANTTTYADLTVAPGLEFHYRVRATGSYGNSLYSNTSTVTTPQGPPSAPTALTAIAASPTRVDLTWVDTSVNEAGFIVERSTDGTNFSEIGTTTSNEVSFVDETVTAGMTYTYRVRATGSYGDSGYSEVATVTTPQNPPTTPSSLSAIAVSTTRVDLGWVDSSINETGFKIERSTDGLTFVQIAVTGANTTSYSDLTAAANVTYTYRIRATSSFGDSGYSAVATVTTPQNPPTSPTSLSAIAAGTTRVDLGWVDTSNNETGFKIERTTDGLNFTQIAVAGANATAYADLTVTANTAYSYRVRATSSYGDSAYSAVATVTTPQNPPSAPSGLAATAASTTRVNLAWVDSSINETGFKIERSTDGINFTQIGVAGANATAYADLTVTANTSYSYRVRATSSYGDSGYSAFAAVTTPQNPPAAPTGLTAVAVNSTRVDLGWVDTSVNESGFTVERSTGGGGFVPIATTAANATVYSDLTVAPGLTYSYRVRATSSYGDSANSNTATVSTPQDPPLAPTALSAVAASGTRVNLTWVDNANNETGFKIERSADGVTFAQIATTGANVLVYADTTVTAGLTYTYRVRAYSSYGNSAYSNTAVVTTPVPLPAAPTTLSAKVVSAKQIDLKWADKSNNESGFSIEISLNGSTWTQLATVAANTVKYSSTGLTANTTYYYRVRAFNAGGTSAYSNTVSGKTKAR